MIAYRCVSTTSSPLACTFRHGALIRVDLGIERTPPKLRRIAECTVLVMIAIVVGGITCFTLQDVLFSHEFEDVAQGTVPLLWVPKSAMPLGPGCRWSRSSMNCCACWAGIRRPTCRRPWTALRAAISDEV